MDLGIGQIAGLIQNIPQSLKVAVSAAMDLNIVPGAVVASAIYVFISLFVFGYEECDGRFLVAEFDCSVIDCGRQCYPDIPGGCEIDSASGFFQLPGKGWNGYGNQYTDDRNYDQQLSQSEAAFNRI